MLTELALVVAIIVFAHYLFNPDQNGE